MLNMQQGKWEEEKEERYKSKLKEAGKRSIYR
jgi:hypothetical protein